MPEADVSAAGADTAAPRFGQLLTRMAAAGLAAGLLAGGWSLLVTAPTIAPALALEEARAAGGHEEELFSRGTQLVGGVLGTVLAALLIAVVLTVVFALVRHRLPARSDFGRLLVLGAIGFAVVVLLPAVAIPANPPAVGDPETIGTRTALYGSVLAAGLLIALLVSAAVSALRSRGLGVPATTAAAAAVALVLVALALVLLPGSPDTIPADVPAGVIWDFRLASLGQLAVLWGGVSIIGSLLVDRLTRGPRPAASR